MASAWKWVTGCIKLATGIEGFSLICNLSFALPCTYVLIKFAYLALIDALVAKSSLTAARFIVV